MIEDIIEKIVVVEEEAAKMIADADVQAKDIVIEATEKADELTRNSKNAIKDKRKSILAAAEQASIKEYNKVLEKGKKHSEELLETVSTEKAEKFILEKIRKKYE